jgi:hypothetical protein
MGAVGWNLYRLGRISEPGLVQKATSMLGMDTMGRKVR